jgi:hypothetical protein
MNFQLPSKPKSLRISDCLPTFENIKSCRPVPEIIDPVFAKTSQNARFLLSENERFGLVFFVKTGSINSGTEKRNVYRINV